MELTIKQIKEKKEELEEKILKLVQNFEKETDCVIFEIEMITKDISKEKFGTTDIYTKVHTGI